MWKQTYSINQNTWSNPLTKRRGSLSSRFWRFTPKIWWTHCLGPQASVANHDINTCRSTSSLHGLRSRENDWVECPTIHDLRTCHKAPPSKGSQHLRAVPFIRWRWWYSGHHSCLPILSSHGPSLYMWTFGGHSPKPQHSVWWQPSLFKKSHLELVPKAPNFIFQMWHHLEMCTFWHHWGSGRKHLSSLKGTEY